MPPVRHRPTHHASTHAGSKHHTPAPLKPGKHGNQARTGHTHDSFQAGQVRGGGKGSVASWVAQAQRVLSAHGVPMSKMNAADIALIIRHESSGNPNAQNNWDSNARAGHPSIGLMQVIGPTFNKFKVAGHGNIRNPVDNIIAGVRYAISRYGSISHVPGVKAVHAGHKYVGY